MRCKSCNSTLSPTEDTYCGKCLSLVKHYEDEETREKWERKDGLTLEEIKDIIQSYNEGC
jgi:hypothetical protein